MFNPFSHERSNFVVIGAIILLASLAIAPGPAMAQAVPAETTVPDDPLLNLNNSSRALYAQAKATAIEHQGPVIIVVGDDLVLRKGNTRVQVRYIPEIFHTLKAIAHVPMAMDVALAAHADHPFQDPILRSPFEMDKEPKPIPPQPPFPDDSLQELRVYRAQIQKAEAAIARVGLTPEQFERQKAILAGCVAFLDKLLTTRTCSKDQRVAFARRMHPLVMANVTDAARAQLDALHRQVSEWKNNLRPEEGEMDFTVLVIGRQLPRKENLAVQYFARLLEENGEGHRIIYAEGLAEEPRALDLLATYRVDTQIAIDFFNDDQRMSRDLLSDAARAYLPLLIDANHPSP